MTKKRTPEPIDVSSGNDGSVLYRGDVGTVATLSDEFTDHHESARDLASAYNNTVCAGIAPEAVPGLLDAVRDLVGPGTLIAGTYPAGTAKKIQALRSALRKAEGGS